MSATSTTALLGLVTLLLVIEHARQSRWFRFPGRLPLPPGPPPIPFLGNLLGIDVNAPYSTFTTWSKKYGDIICVRALGGKFIVLNTEEAAVALLDKRSQTYSDRPIFPLGNLFHWDWPTTSARYGPRFRSHRRLLHQVLNPQSATSYRPRQLQKAYEMLQHLLKDSTRYADHFTTFSSAVMTEVTYGYSKDENEDETFVTSMQRSADIVLHNVTIQLSMVCITFPFVKALPSWFPGMGFKAGAAECRRLAVEAINSPYAWVKRRIDKGIAVPSMVSDAIARYRLNDDSENPELVQAVKDSAATLIAASIETTNATLVVFVYAMMNHPEVQSRAQTEIDSVVGRERLPDLDDRASLPYVGAVVRETLRWHPVLPIGIPHATTADDVYEGYHIPRGVSVMSNIWAMSRNETKYPNPDAFTPDRFLRGDGTLDEDEVSFVFGFGRRICPGRHVTHTSLWCAIVCVLALFRIERTEGSDEVTWTRGLASHPFPFPCKFVPRDGDTVDAQKLASLMRAGVGRAGS